MAKLTFRKLSPSELAKATGEIKPNQPDEFLHGSGITKKLAEKSVKQSLSAEEKSLQADKRDISKEALRKFEDEAAANASILEIKKKTDIQLDEYQQAAVDGVLTNAHWCIIGPAGSGKTTIENMAIENIIGHLPEIEISRTNVKTKGTDANADAKIYSFAVIAFTGKAVQQSKRSLPEKFHLNCMTGHRCLGYAPTMELRDDIKNPGTLKEIRVFRPTFNSMNKLPYDLIIIEEASMFPVKLFNELIEATKPGTRFGFIGDINQLPPVQDYSVLPFAMLAYPTFELKKIHRQAAENPIIANAHRILQGQMPIPDNKHFVMKNIDDGSMTASGQILKFVKGLHQKGVFDAMRDTLIVQANKTEIGQLYLNADLVNYFNPPKMDANGVVLNRRIMIKASRGMKMLAIGDKIMQLENDADLGLTNGMVGVIVDITKNGMWRDNKLGFHDAVDNLKELSLDSDDFELEAEENGDDEDETEEKEDKEKDKDENQRQASHVTTIRFAATDNDIEVKLQTVGQYNKVTHAYAITCHKSQGGEYPHVMIAFHSRLARMCNREWLYTAVTRAKERAFLFYNNRALQLCLKNQAIKGQTIHEKAKSFLAYIDDPNKTTPNLPPARQVEARPVNEENAA